MEMVQKGDNLTINGKRFEVVTSGEFYNREDQFITVKTPQGARFLVPVELWNQADPDGAQMVDPAQRMENVVRSFGPSLPGPEKMEKRATFMEELRALINRHSAENGSDTPDFLLAAYLYDCLVAFDRTVRDRERWYGRRKAEPGDPAQHIVFQKPHLEQKEDKRGAWEKGGFSPRQVGMPEEKE
jgi:hypothetical protein